MCQNWEALDSTAVSIFVAILIELTNTETAVVSPPRALLNFQKATNQRGVLSGAFFWSAQNIQSILIGPNFGAEVPLTAMPLSAPEY